MKTIISRQNPEIKNLTKLKQAKYRKIEKKFIAEGYRTCQTLIASGGHLIKLYVTELTLEQGKKMTNRNNLICVNNLVMEKISSASTPSGILAIFAIPELPKPSTMRPGLVLAQIADPGNMGTLIRSCAAMGFPSIVTIGGADVWSSKVIQATAGTIGFTQIYNLSWKELMEHKKNLKLVALVPSEGKKPSKIDLKNSLLVVGSEAHGIPEQWIADCDETLTIEMPGKTESLNAAVAGSIALYLAGK